MVVETFFNFYVTLDSIQVLSHQRQSATTMRAELELTMTPTTAVATTPHVLLRMSLAYTSIDITVGAIGYVANLLKSDGQRRTVLL